ncbi:Diphthine methyltransferase [Saguinus oedipus]|uniref:Diphthine methyltransferase n=1 Tax=Saguinus oedipus TaxID=9490 RepID=A0ABQ9WHT6_SAGOE|nr:Diphthine methyltransferase [Saguinus oedipus]
MGFAVSRTRDQPLKIISSDSTGQLHLLMVNETGSRLQKVASWQAHQFEAWIAAFNYWHTEIVYSEPPSKATQGTFLTNINGLAEEGHFPSLVMLMLLCLHTGGDDGLLRGWDTRTPGRFLFTSMRSLPKGQHSVPTPAPVP